MRKKLPIGCKVEFDVAGYIGEAISRDNFIENEDGLDILYYELEVLSGDNMDIHRNAVGKLIVNDWEVKAIR